MILCLVNVLIFSTILSICEEKTDRNLPFLLCHVASFRPTDNKKVSFLNIRLSRAVKLQFYFEIVVFVEKFFVLISCLHENMIGMWLQQT